MPVWDTSGSTSMASTLLFYPWPCPPSPSPFPPVMVYIQGDDWRAKDDVPNGPLFNPLPFPAKANDLGPVQKAASSAHQPKDSIHLPLLVWILFAPSLLGATGTRFGELWASWPTTH